MIRPEVLDAMVAAGCTAEQIAAAVKASMKADMDADEARRAAKRAANAERQRRHRNANNALSRVTERDEALPPRPPQRVSPVPPSQTSPRSGPKGPSLPPGECVLDAPAPAAAMDEAERDLRHQIIQAFDAVGMQVTPPLHNVGMWLSRGYPPALIADVVIPGIKRGITTLAYFEKVLPKEFARMNAPEPRPPPGGGSQPETATVTRLRPRNEPSILDIGRSLIDRPPTGLG